METLEPSRAQAPQMFDRISGTYDLLNHLLSFGLDFYWRAKLASFAKPSHRKILDCATGTGDQLMAVLKKCSPEIKAWGVDPSVEMLKVAEEKFKKTNFGSQTEFMLGKADQLPFEDGHFDLISMSFGIRNVENVDKALKELRRVTNKDGVVLILEFSLPRCRVMRAGHSFYLRKIVPIIGKLIAKDLDAYRYLSRTIKTFPYGSAFCRLVEDAGFSKCTAHRLSFGITTLYVATP